jgi:hypothetical protein
MHRDQNNKIFLTALSVGWKRKQDFLCAEVKMEFWADFHCLKKKYIGSNDNLRLFTYTAQRLYTISLDIWTQ